MDQIGGNYGWKAIEGLETFNSTVYDYIVSHGEEIIYPIIAYPRKDGIAVTGVYYYEGNRYPKLTDSLLIVDYKGSVMKHNYDDETVVWSYEIMFQAKSMIHGLGLDLDMTKEAMRGLYPSFTTQNFYSKYIQDIYLQHYMETMILNLKYDKSLISI